MNRFIRQNALDGDGATIFTNGQTASPLYNYSYPYLV